MEEKNSNQLFIPGSIILAGALVAGAVVFTGGGASGNGEMGDGNDHSGNTLSAAAADVRPVSEEDHIKGNPDAEVSIIEFSDFECPFCSRHHPTLARAVEEFDGKVNWAYRHFPLTSIHSEAQQAAVASECVASIAGNDAFWEFTDQLFENQRQLGTDLYNNLVTSLGVDINEFNSCLSSGEMLARVSEDLDEVIAAGGRGTPYSIVVSKKGKFPFSGALPYAQVEQIIKQALDN